MAHRVFADYRTRGQICCLKPARATIQFDLATRNLSDEKVFVSNEAGVQGRVENNIGHFLGAVFDAQAVNMCFAGFKATGRQYEGAPDTIMASKPDHQNGDIQHLRVVGEVKIPWVIEHNLDVAIREDHNIRHLLGQPIRYMYDLQCQYGFLTNYKETIFLRQINDGGTWVIEHTNCPVPGQLHSF
jgi:hypothetical protein